MQVAEPREFTVNDRLGPLVLKGEILADFRYQDSMKPRWTDMALYKVTDPKSRYRYALEITARSYVYHRVDASCTSKRHYLTTVGEVYESNQRWKKLIPCTKCRPDDLGDLSDDAQISEERSVPHLYLCFNARDIIKKLYLRNGEISEMAADLLRAAAVRDPHIAKAWQTPRRV